MWQELTDWRKTKSDLRQMLARANEINMMPGYREALVDTQETDSEFVISAEMPGLEKKDIVVRPHEQGIEIKGEKHFETEKKHKGEYRYEHQYAGFYQYVKLPSNAQLKKAKATYKNGILEVHVPKNVSATTEQIAVE